MASDDIVVSILMPARNSAKTIRDSMQSVIAQTCVGWELIVIDDGSTDGTVSIVEEVMRSETRVQLILLSQNIGAAGARNRGLEAAKGRYIAFLDSDDLWLPNKLERQISDMKDHAVALSYSGYHRVAESGQLIETVTVPEQITYQGLLGRNFIGCLTAVYDTQVFGKVPMPDLQRQHDYALWLDLARRDSRMKGLNEPLAIYRVGRNSLSKNKFLAAQDMWRVYRKHQKLSWARSVRHLLSYSVFGLRHRLVQNPPNGAPFLASPID